MSDLKKIISKGKGLNLDFKVRIDDQKKIARTLVAFANSSGGKLFIGIKDNGKIAGCNPEEEFHLIESAASVYCSPAVKMESRVWKEDHHLILEVDVPVSKEKHKAKDENGDLQFYHRIEDNTLLGNKITFLLWKFEQEGNTKPEKFDDEVTDFMKLIGELEPVTISKLFRISPLKKNRVNQLIAALVHWNVLERKILESGIAYSLKE